MRRGTSVLLVLLALLGFAGDASAQQNPTNPCTASASEFTIEQNFPNPFAAGSTTRIPFTLCESLFAEGRSVVVSLRVVNLIQQFVAAPIALNHPSGTGVPATQLEYVQPGRYFASWDGRDSNGALVASGVYGVQLMIPGKTPVFKRISVSR
jgi:hypothetical protein